MTFWSHWYVLYSYDVPEGDPSADPLFHWWTTNQKISQLFLQGASRSPSSTSPPASLLALIYTEKQVILLALCTSFAANSSVFIVQPAAVQTPSRLLPLLPSISDHGSLFDLGRYSMSRCCFCAPNLTCTWPESLFSAGKHKKAEFGQTLIKSWHFVFIRLTLYI